jgi:hypothetical protein
MPFVDDALLAAGAGNRDFLLVVQDMGRVAGADDGRKSQLPADDGGMRGAARRDR